MQRPDNEAKIYFTDFAALESCDPQSQTLKAAPFVLTVSSVGRFHDLLPYCPKLCEVRHAGASGTQQE
ncbi:MAG: hypothetical protein AAFX86_14765 [Pseudomonadota bacterium]